MTSSRWPLSETWKWTRISHVERHCLNLWGLSARLKELLLRRRSTWGLSRLMQSACFRAGTTWWSCWRSLAKWSSLISCSTSQGLWRASLAVTVSSTFTQKRQVATLYRIIFPKNYHCSPVFPNNQLWCSCCQKEICVWMRFWVIINGSSVKLIRNVKMCLVSGQCW